MIDDHHEILYKEKGYGEEGLFGEGPFQPTLSIDGQERRGQSAPCLFSQKTARYFLMFARMSSNVSAKARRSSSGMLRAGEKAQDDFVGQVADKAAADEFFPNGLRGEGQLDADHEAEAAYFLNRSGGGFR